MAAKPQALRAMQLRSRNSWIKKRRTRLSKDVIFKKPRIPPPPPSRPKAVGKEKKMLSHFPVTFNVVKDTELINLQKYQPLIKLERLRVLPPPTPPQPIQNVIIPPAEVILISDDENETPPPPPPPPPPTPTRDEIIDALISENSEIIEDVISKSSLEASGIVASEAIRQVILKRVNDALEEILSKTEIRALPEAIRKVAQNALNEAILQAITLPLISDQDKLKEIIQISDEDISSLLPSEMEDDQLTGILDILMEGDERKIKRIRVRRHRRPSSSSAGEDDDNDDEDPQPNNLLQQAAWDLPFPPPSTSQLPTWPIVSSSPNFTLCCNPPDPPPNMVLTHKKHMIPLLSLQVLRSYYVRPKSPELITIRSRSSSPSPQSPPPPPPLTPAPTPSPLPPPPPLRPSPSVASSSSRHRPGTSVSSSSSSRAPAVSSSSESDPDYDPTPKPKKKRKFTHFKRNNFHKT